MSTVTTTVPPCPPWCTEEPGHDYESVLLDGSAITRSHVADFGSAWVHVEEIAAPGQPVRLTAPRIHVDDDPNDLTADGAREAAAALLRAADKLDEIMRTEASA